ncbi:hypothetical protein C8Q80DRAFT_266373 [Daedaleopsis nitida]|nr:hypothetical protein C8Q80DRAFT_266373 [Daedaleopsis nitida]
MLYTGLWGAGCRAVACSLLLDASVLPPHTRSSPSPLSLSLSLSSLVLRLLALAFSVIYSELNVLCRVVVGTRPAILQLHMSHP